MLLNLPFNRLKAFSTTTLCLILKLHSSGVKFPGSVYSFISHSLRAKAESPNIRGGTRTPDIITDMSGGRKVRAQHRANSGEFLKRRASCTLPSHPTQISRKRWSKSFIPTMARLFPKQVRSWLGPNTTNR